MTPHGKLVKLKLLIIKWEYNTHQKFTTMFDGSVYTLHDVHQYIDWYENDPSRLNMQYMMRTANHMYKIIKGYEE